MDELNPWKTGFAIISAVILLAVSVYTVIKLRKQVSKRENEEQEKSADRLNNNSRDKPDKKKL